MSRIQVFVASPATRLTLLAAFWTVAACGSEPDSSAPLCEYQERPARSFRLFAVGHQLRVEDVISVATFRDSIRATVERDVVPHLATDRPNVLVFPESVSLAAVFAGPRGEAARAASSTGEAFTSLFDGYDAVFRFYSDLDRLEPLQRLLMASTTDVVWRATHETFSEIAIDYGVYVVTGADVGDAEEATDPEIAAVVGDPERPEGSPAYWLPDVAVYNQALFYDPSGELTGRVRKEYLTDMEVGSLALNGGLPERLGPVAIGDFSRATALISRDAWMGPALDRMALQGADSVLQLEAYGGGWGYGGEELDQLGPWHPDNLKRSSWSSVQKYPEIRAAVAPMLVGNFFEVIFDGQSFAVRDGTPEDEPLSLMAQEPDTGWAAVAPWVVKEPEGTVAERRVVLNEVAQALAPGGAMENEYLPATVFVDVDLPADDGHPVVADLGDTSGAMFGNSTAISATTAGRQRMVSATVAGDGSLVAAWEDSRLCAGQIFTAASKDGGQSWSEYQRVREGNRPQRSPSLVTLVDGTLLLAWQEVTGEGTSEIRVARSEDGGQSWGKANVVDAEATILAWTPQLAVDASTGTVHLVFVDGRADGNWRVYYSRSEDGGKSFEPTRRLDPRDRSLSFDDLTYTDEWTPSIAAQGGKVVVAYTHRQRPDEAEQPSIDVFVTQSEDGGSSFAEPVAMDTGGFPERLAADLDLALAADGQFVATWTSLRGSGDDSDIVVATAADNLHIGPDATVARYQWLPSIAAVEGGYLVAWQDFRNGSNDIYLARWSAAEGFGEALRIDDGGSTGAQAWRPHLLVHEDRIHVFWEDSRSGFAQIRVVSGTLADLESGR